MLGEESRKFDRWLLGLMSFFPKLRRQRQAGLCELEVSPVYIVSYRLNQSYTVWKGSWGEEETTEMSY